MPRRGGFFKNQSYILLDESKKEQTDLLIDKITDKDIYQFVLLPFLSLKDRAALSVTSKTYQALDDGIQKVIILQKWKSIIPKNPLDYSRLIRVVTDNFDMHDVRIKAPSLHKICWASAFGMIAIVFAGLFLGECLEFVSEQEQMDQIGNGTQVNARSFRGAFCLLSESISLLSFFFFLVFFISYMRTRSALSERLELQQFYSTAPSIDVQECFNEFNIKFPHDKMDIMPTSCHEFHEKVDRKCYEIEFFRPFSPKDSFSISIEEDRKMEGVGLDG